jgi:hypothetical protein
MLQSKNKSASVQQIIVPKLWEKQTLNQSKTLFKSAKPQVTVDMSPKKDRPTEKNASTYNLLNPTNVGSHFAYRTPLVDIQQKSDKLQHKYEPQYKQDKKWLDYY